jgi:sulfatase modifying factor 1
VNRLRNRAFVLVVGALVGAGCTLVVGDGKYAVVTDGGAGAEGSPGDGAGGGDANANLDAASSGPEDAEAADAEDAGPCTVGTRRCVGGSVETCASDAGWSPAWSCATGTCTAGDCTGATATAPSCATSGAGRTTCGTDGGESCCLSEEIPTGAYDRVFAADGGGRADRATISGFRLDKYLVTVGRFREFFGAWNASPAVATPDAGAGKHVHLNGGRGLANSASAGKYESGWASSDDGYVTLARTPSDLACDSYATWTAATGGHEMLPINCVNWYEAYAFCIWDGGFLPSEAEFEYAATGGSEERYYPWGANGPGTANQYAIYGTGGTAPICYYPTSAACTGTTNIAPVGSALLGAGLWGQVDLGGDVATWGLDSYASYVVPCTDCAYLNATAAGRVIRGGGFKYAALNLASAQRFAFPPLTDAGAATNSDTWGVRCARVP